MYQETKTQVQTPVGVKVLLGVGIALAIGSVGASLGFAGIINSRNTNGVNINNTNAIIVNDNVNLPPPPPPVPPITFLTITPYGPSSGIFTRTSPFNALSFKLIEDARYDATLSKVVVDYSITSSRRGSWSIGTAKLYDDESGMQICDNGAINPTNIKFNNCNTTTIPAGMFKNLSVRLTVAGTPTTTDALRLSISNFGSPTVVGAIQWSWDDPSAYPPAVNVMWVNGPTSPIAKVSLY